METTHSKAGLDKIIGKNIRFERLTRDMTLNELSESLDITPSHLRLMEAGNRGTTSINLLKFSKFFGIPTDQFFIPPNTGKKAGDEPSTPTNATRKKIQALVAVADDSSLEFIASMIKGINSYSKQKS